MALPRAAVLGAPLRARRWYSHRYNRIGYYRLAALAARVVPRRGRLVLARAMARLALRLLPEERESTRRNLARVLGTDGGPRLDAAIRGVFTNFGVCLGDLLTLNRSPLASLRRYLDRVEGGEHLSAAAEAGRGLIVATAHLGNWELGGRLLAGQSGHPTHVVLAAEEDPAVEALLRRSGGPIRFITPRSPTVSLALLAALRRNGTVALQADRATGGRADVRLPFFGAPAPFPLGPVLLASASGAPVLPAFCVLAARARYRIVLGAPIRVERGGEAAALAALVRAIERCIADHPEQWFNFYDVWEERGG